MAERETPRDADALLAEIPYCRHLASPPRAKDTG